MIDKAAAEDLIRQMQVGPTHPDYLTHRARLDVLLVEKPRAADGRSHESDQRLGGGVVETGPRL